MAENPTPTRPQLGQLVPEGRAGGNPSSLGAGSALDLPDSSEVGAESESSLCADLSPIRRCRFDVDDTTPCQLPTSRRVDAGRRQRQPRPTQVSSTGSDRLRNRSVVYINMLAVSGGTGPGTIAAWRFPRGLNGVVVSRYGNNVSGLDRSAAVPDPEEQV